MYLYKARKVSIYTGRTLARQTFATEQEGATFINLNQSINGVTVWILKKAKAPTCKLCGKYYTGKECAECNQEPLF